MMDQAIELSMEYYGLRKRKQRGVFTFRDLMHSAGVLSSNENNWAVGQWLVSFAAKRGVQPLRLLAKKTNPNPSVSAPHCIAHYPMHLFDEAERELKTLWNDKERQLTMEFENGD